MKHHKIPTSIDREAFSRWGNGLMMVNNNFDLSMPFNGVCSPSNITYEAEQAACAIGYAPWFEVGNPENYKLEDSLTGLRSFKAGGWNEYALDIVSGDVRLGLWIGSQCWGATNEQIKKVSHVPNIKCIGVDNTAIGAGQRILYALQNGVPSLEIIYDMWKGKSTLPYIGIMSDIETKFDIRDYKNYDEALKKNSNLILV